jgi:cation:H+ antiporter
MDLITFVLLGMGFVLLLLGADLLVRGASNLALTLGMSPLIIGLTIVAFGTSAPELAINLRSALTGQPELAIGNVIGSNILNILLLLGIAAIIAPIKISHRLIKLDLPVMIGASFLFLGLALDNTLGRWDGLLLLSGIIFYTWFSIRQSSPKVQEIPTDSISKLTPRNNYQHIILQLIEIIVGLVLLVQGSQWLVNGAVAIAQFLGISELIIGLTIVAIGTSLPEIATVVIASLRSKHELVVGNAIGSNLFNILLVLGISSLIAPAGIEVPTSALVFDIPVMIAVAVACLPIFFTDYLIEAWEGWLFLAYYVAYTLYLVLNASQHALLPAFSVIMLGFVIPLTTLTLLILVWRAIKVSANHRH